MNYNYVRQQISLQPQTCFEGDRLEDFDPLRDTLRGLLERIISLEEAVYERPEQPEPEQTPALKSLEESNKQALGIWGPTKLECKVKNGIACPECGAELFDTNTFQQLATWPPQYRVHCENCDFEGTRF